MAATFSVSQTSSIALNLKKYGSPLSKSLPKPYIESFQLQNTKKSPPPPPKNFPQTKTVPGSSFNFNKSSFLSRINTLNKPPKVSASTETVVEEKLVEADKLAVSLIRLLPEKIQPYAYLARLHRPIGAVLIAWPCIWAIALAAEPGSLPDWKMVALFSLVAFWTKNIACTINDYFDKDFDSQVERTKGRPIASGAITGLQALIFLGIQLVLGFAFLQPVNQLSRLLWVSWLPLIFTYPLMKRVTFWPQAHLGFSANWGVLCSWAAIRGSLQPAIVFPLLIGCFFWMLIIDTIYAHEDKTDDVKAGVKSTALFLGDSTKLWNIVFGVASIASFALSGFNANIGI
ncbi:OLC1v1016372C1 [Oldenlandia corymbosa var. corymbosa]|uniref:OLC1v1016372C1 n=1 Tax=Oldenlandia corymbosa var. corymbosa TaxID=529605 RepID=A0AAV1E5U3_OLDCO|nr:OLC1v1016372C1 [Oldenlandia corymbosa var. corymbosa]